MAIFDMLQGHLDQSAVEQVSRQLGVSRATAQTAIAAALPMVLGGMARHASSPDGAAAIHQAALTHQDALDNVPTLLRAGPPADLGGAQGGLLGRILGGHQQTVQQGVQQASGLDPQKARQLLLILAPIVMGALARRQFGRQAAQQAGAQPAQPAQPAQQLQPTDPGQLSGYLQEEGQIAQQHAQRQAPQLGGLLGRLGEMFGSRP
jgi:hypothetical protein